MRAMIRTTISAVRKIILTQSRRYGSEDAHPTAVRALQNKVALVTGSTSGIGLEVATVLARNGANIVLNGFCDPKEIDNIQVRLKRKYEVDIHYVGGDLTKRNDVNTLCQKVDSLCPNGLDILVNNAGFQHVSRIEDFPLEKWDELLAILLTAPFLLTQHFISRLKNKGWGRIINIASMHGLRASPNKAAYVSAKHGVLGLTKVIALETASTGVTCNAVCPGYVDTPIYRKQLERKALDEGCDLETAKKKFLQPVHPTLEVITSEQVAELVLFLCSRAADQMTGSVLTMDGGWSAR
ncbi:hypothetical protein ACJMK2_011442 [Sinanodonta woodiana]|uniref:3-oxoacyl-[acyl-carrier-protein] reductase n=1 Tax=Sinanodonta woodiana TaxID=1069815 RepID=A0ABD3V511_SINWO